ncbi:hypothetical protein DENIS_2846 [Desulfonema ishimotonii]|uniref:histidine kinase n=1 Tax=Desulfonema ishimotonii TaxID=45657 RepID=A0A401FY70_9BACT|nr:PAS domain S-box protein [Desulfonema ishimotonii]GBC61884.1 hypothetical protein DENIS_2846 [Desulfonema ishimotonii]
MQKKSSSEQLEQKIRALEETLAANKAELDELRNKKLLFEQIIERTPLSLVIFDRQLRYLGYAKKYLEDYGITATDLLGRHHYEVFPDIPAEWKKDHLKCLAGQSIGPQEERITRAGGKQLWVKRELIPWRNNVGEIGGGIVFNEVITRRKEEQITLRKRVRKFRLLAEHSPLSIVIIQDGLFAYSNKATYSLFEYTPEEIAAWEPDDLARVIHPEDREFVIGKMDRTVTKIPEDKRTHAPYRIISKSGIVKWVRQYSRPVVYQGRPANMATLIDITERIEALEALGKSEARHRAFSDVTFEAIFISEKGVCMETNRAATEMFGYTYDELLGIFGTDVIAEESREIVRRNMLSGYEKPYEIIAQRKDGTKFHAEIRGKIADYKNRSVRITVVRDIDQERKALQALRESEQRYRELVESISDALYAASPEGTIIYIASTINDILGFSASEIIGRNYLDFVDETDKARIRKEFANRQRGIGIRESKEYRLLDKSGKACWVRMSTTPVIKDGQVVELRGVLSDIRKQKQTEEEKKQLEVRLERAKRMEALGTLAGSVAHDLNNILSGVVSYPELLLMDIPEDSPLRKPIQTIRKSGEKAAAIVQDLLTLARQSVIAPKPVNMNQLIVEYLKSPEAEKLRIEHPDVSFHTNLAPDLFNISGSPFHLFKVIMNLAHNGAEAIPEKGELGIRTRNFYMEKPLRGTANWREGEYIEIAVTDSGVGIAPENVERIFEPFYTRKKMGRSGTGLGMTVVWGTVRDHSGYIDVDSTPGRGTSVKVYLPACHRKIKNSPAPASVSSLMGRGESILVVDDMKEQREIVSKILTRLGYTVKAVPSGETAVEYLKNHSADLIVMDMIMKDGMDGLETYRKIIEINPDQRAIISSGFSKTERVKEAQKLGVGTYVRKPYTMEKIGIAILNELRKPFSERT